MWLSLAAAAGNKDADEITNRDAVAARLTTEQLVEGHGTKAPEFSRELGQILVQRFGL
jgi:hypothetical protein